MTLKTTTPEENWSGGTSLGKGSSSSSGPPKTNFWAIAGGAIGGIVAVALAFVGAELLRRRRRRILRLFSHLKSPSTSSGAMEEGCSPAELMARARVTWGGVCTVELPAEEVAREMDTKP